MATPVRRLVTFLVLMLVPVPLAGCTGDDAGGRPAGTLSLPLFAAERTQVIDRRTVLQPCTAAAEADEIDGNDAVATRVATVVLPVAYRVESFPQDLPLATLARDDAETYLATCTFVIGRGIDELRVQGRDVFSLTLPARQSLRDALPHLSPRGTPEGVADGLPVFAGRTGERATYRLRVPGTDVYDVVALQSGGVRLTWLAPAGRTQVEARAGRRLWRDVRASLAVRSPAASDGDPDARSDDTAPGEPTYEPSVFGPRTTTTPPTGYTAVSCTTGRGVVTFWAPDRLTRGRTCSLSRQRPLQAELERLTVTADIDAPLRELYEEESEFELDAGDDATSDLEYAADVPGPDGRGAESLVYTAYNDGSPEETHIVQAGGVRVSWTVLPGAWGPQAGELAMLLDSLGVSRG